MRDPSGRFADLAKYGAGVEPLLAACVAASPNFRGIRISARRLARG
jgi:hypothetical protein